MNFDLLEFLLLNDTEPKYLKYQKALIFQIRERKNYDFISRFYDTGKAREQFITRMNEQWSDFFSLALQEKTVPSNQIRRYSIETLYFSDEEAVMAVNRDSCLSDYISNSSDYLDIEHPDIKRLVSEFSLIGVSFVGIDYDKADKALFDAVYQQSLYALTFKNITLMISKEYDIENISDVIHKNYTLVLSRSDSSLARYVSRNMPDYTDIILANCDGNISDDDNVAIDLLNNGDVEIDAKKQYIKLLSTIIRQITQVTDPDLWTMMIDQGVVVFSVDNFVNYSQKHGIDATIIKYINTATIEFDFTYIFDNFGKETAVSLYDNVAICNDIATDKYKKILIDLGYYFDQFEAEDITDEKFKVLIDEKILQMDVVGLKFVRDKYAKHLLSFIQRNLNEYLALQTAEVFSLEEALQVIVWDFDDDKKTELLSLTDEPISILGKRYTDTVNAYIIVNNFKADDKCSLYVNYSIYGEKAKEAIADLAVTTVGVREIITQNMNVDDALLSVLLHADGVSNEQKLMIFTMTIPNLNEDTCKAHFDELGLSELKGIFTKSSGRRNYEKKQ